MGTLEQLHGVFSGMPVPFMGMNHHLMEGRSAFGMLNRDLCVASMGLGATCAPYATPPLQTTPSFKEAAWQLHEVTRQMQQLARQLSDARQQQAQHSASFHVLLKDLVSTQKQQHTALESLRSLQTDPGMPTASPQSVASSSDLLHQLHSMSQELQYYKRLAEEHQRTPQLHQLQSQLDAMQHDLAATQQLNSRLLHERSTLIMRLQQLMNQLVTLQDRPPAPAPHLGLDSAIASLDGAISSKLNELTHQMADLCVELADGGVNSHLEEGAARGVGKAVREPLLAGKADRASVVSGVRAAGSARGNRTADMVVEQRERGMLDGEGAAMEGVLIDLGEDVSGREVAMEVDRVSEDDVRKKLAHMAALEAELQQSKGQLVESRQQLHEAEEKVQELQRKLLEQQETKEQLLAAQSQLQQNNEAAAQLQSLQQQLLHQREGVEQLHAANAQLHEQLLQKDEDAAQLQQMQEELQQQHEKASRQLQESSKQLEQSSKQIHDLQSQIQQQQQQASSKIVSLQAQLIEQQAAHATLQETNTQLQESNSLLQEAHTQLQQRLSVVLTELDSLKAHRDQLQSDLTSLQGQQASQVQTSSSTSTTDLTTINTNVLPSDPELLPSPSPTFAPRSSTRARDQEPPTPLWPNLHSLRKGNSHEESVPSSGSVTPVGRGGPHELSSSLILANAQVEGLRRQRDEAESKLQSLLGLIQQAMTQETMNGSEGFRLESKAHSAELAALQKLCAAITPTSCVRSSAAVLSQRSSQLQATVQAALAGIKSLRAELTADGSFTDGPMVDEDGDTPMSAPGKSLLSAIKEAVPSETSLDASSCAENLPPPPEGIQPEWRELYYQDSKKFNELWEEAQTSADMTGSLWPKQEPQELPVLEQLASLPLSTRHSATPPSVPEALPHAMHDEHYDDLDTQHADAAAVAVTYPPPPPGLPDDLVALYYELGPDMFFQLLNDAQQEAQA